MLVILFVDNAAIFDPLGSGSTACHVLYLEVERLEPIQRLGQWTTVQMDMLLNEPDSFIDQQLQILGKIPVSDGNGNAH
jgi:hypothetical protein